MKEITLPCTHDFCLRDSYCPNDFKITYRNTIHGFQIMSQCRLPVTMENYVNFNYFCDAINFEGVSILKFKMFLEDR